MKKNKGKNKEKIQRKEIIKDKIITIKLESSVLNRIDSYAEKMKLNRSQLLRNFIDTGLDDIKVMNTTGLLNLSVKGYDLLASIKEALKNQHFSIDGQNFILKL